MTVTEETPTKSDSKATHIMYVWCVYVSVYRQRNASVPSQISVLLSVNLLRVLVRILIRCVCHIVVLECFIMFYYCRMVEVLLDSVRLCLLVIVLFPRRLRYVVYFCVCHSVNICCVVGWMEVFWPE